MDFQYKKFTGKICDEWYQKFFPRQFGAENTLEQYFSTIFSGSFKSTLDLDTLYKNICMTLPKILLVQRISVTFPCCPSKIAEKIFLFNWQNLGQDWRTKKVLSLNSESQRFCCCVFKELMFFLLAILSFESISREQTETVLKAMLKPAKEVIFRIGKKGIVKFYWRTSEDLSRN